MKLMTYAALVALSCAVGCGEKKSTVYDGVADGWSGPPASGSAPGSAVAIDAAAAIAIDAGSAVAVTIDATPEPDAPPAVHVVEMSPLGVATMTFNEVKMTATMQVPDGWATGKHELSDPFGFHFEPPNAYGRPYIDLILFDDTPVEKRIKSEYGDRRKAWKGEKLTITKEEALTDGKLISVEIDAQKTRDIHYVETICFWGKPGTNNVFRLNAFAEKKDEALQATFESICKAVTFADF